jgi:nucleoside diphosphate kinase
VLQTWFRGQFGTCSSNSTVPIVPPPPPCAGLALQIPPTGTIRQGFHIQLPHLSRDASSVAGDSGPMQHMQLKFTVPIVPPPPCAAVGLTDPPSGTIRQDFHIQTTHTCPRDATSVAQVVHNSAHAAQILPSNCSATTTMCCGGIGTSDPPTGTIRQGFHIKLYTYPRDASSCRRDSGPMQHMQLKFYRSTCSLTRHHVLRWDWHFRSLQHKTGSHQLSTPIPGTQPVLQRWFGGQFGTWSSNSTVPIVPPPPPCAAVGLAFRSLWYHKTRLPHPNYSHCPRATSVAEVVWGPIRHMQLKFYRSNCSATTTILTVVGTSDPPSGTIRQGFHIQTTTPVPEDATSVAHVVPGPIRHMQLKFTVHCSATTTMCCGGIGTSDPPSGYHQTRLPSKLPTYQDTTSVAVWFRGLFGTCSSNSNVPIVPPPPPFAGGIGTQIHPLVP